MMEQRSGIPVDGSARRETVAVGGLRYARREPCERERARSAAPRTQATAGKRALISRTPTAPTRPAGAFARAVTLVRRLARRLPTLLLAAGFGTACTAEDPRPNVLLVTIDTLRADHLPFHGYDRNTTPMLSRWIDEAVVFDDCISPLPLTDPSIASMMTGLLPVHHGVRHTRQKLAPSFETLAEVLQDAGYTTAAFTARIGLLKGVGLGRGFAQRDEQVLAPEEHGQFKWNSPRGAEKRQRRAWEVTKSVFEWLETDPERPVFVWLQYFDPHAYYDPKEPFAETWPPAEVAAPSQPLRAWWGIPEDLGDMIRRYDEEILTADYYLGLLVDRLRELELWENTLVIVTSDHGESLGDRGYLDHGEWLYAEQTRVPLVMKLPGSRAAGRRVEEPVQLIDLPATILDVLGTATPAAERFRAGMDGTSLAPLLDGRPLSPRVALIESENCPAPNTLTSLTMKCSPPGPEGKIRAVYDGRFKLIVTPREDGVRLELYDLEADPGERVDRSESEPERVRALLAHLEGSGDGAAPALEVDPELAEKLRSLGYLD